MPQLDKKAIEVFSGKVVRKDLVRKVKVGANVPVFVLEYLLGKYCATDDPLAMEAGLKVVNSTLAENFVRPDEANKAQSFVREKGKHTLIDKVKVRYLSHDDKYWAEFVNFGHKNVHVPEHYVRDFDRLLMGGIWAQVDIRHQFDEEAKGKRSPFWIDKIQPIQVASFDLEDYRECRKEFSTDEWIDLLGNRISCTAGVSLVVAVYSALKKQSVSPGLMILGDLSIQGNIKALSSLVEPLQLGMDNGARRALIPLENKRHFLEVSGDIIERVDPIFYSDPFTAAIKALGMK